KNGRRQSASVAFLDPIRTRRNLTIRTGVTVDRVRFEGRRAVGVDCRLAGQRVRYSARREVILSAGAINSPQILQHSGIGPGELLRSCGIEVLQDSPDVGRRLLEHLCFAMTFRLQGERGINHRLYGVGLAGSVLEYLAFHSGPLATGPFEVGAFVRTAPAQ